MNDDINNSLSVKEENRDWVLMKCLLQAQRETTRAMEQHTLSALNEERELTDKELKNSLKQARHSHVRAIEDIDTALSALSEE